MGLTISRSIIQSHGGRLWPAQTPSKELRSISLCRASYDLKINCMTGINKGGRSSGVAGKSSGAAHRAKPA